MLSAIISYICIVLSTNGCFYVGIEGYLFDLPPYGSPSPNGASYGAGLYTYEDEKMEDGYTCTVYSSDMIENATYVDSAFHSARVFGGLANGLCGVSVILLIVATCIEFSPKALKGVALCLFCASIFQWLTFVFFASALCDAFTSCNFSYGAGFGIAGGILAFLTSMLCYKVPPARDPFADDTESAPLPQSYPHAELLSGTATPPLPAQFKVLATYKLQATLSLVLVRGSVLDFAAPSPAVLIGVADDATKVDNIISQPMPPLAAIVNAANAGCLGGGGVDGAISAAGGANLDRDRHQLPVISPPFDNTTDNNCDYRKVRCPVGGAVVTGPGDYGSLKVPYVIHAVGPNYGDYENNEFDLDDDIEENDRDQKESFNLDSVHALLKSAYQAALDRAVEHKIKHVAFCLLSAGIFRGSQSLETVLKIGMTGILEWSQAHGKKTATGKKAATGKKCLSQIVVCAFTEQECWTLKEVCDDMLRS